ncbi:type IV pilin-like G/H family protein [Pseudanabaena galeata UHCC 0370]|uniref:Type IV pilin-like G/H family protein n=1 Tax=Pseudanabaena galeata UHCC 0370 TaxID=3110310 RepID=A0ABU5TFD3_9CYAN|nr:type IV pilin-like G/H family protein [Pseudanabaena galeata]MEA5476960.1 type IV pilin-like G/H family protein [Pseudanabaena galeata UHCC 0370]
MPQKSPTKFVVWQWALISFGSALVLAIASYGAFNLIGNSQGSNTTSKSLALQNKNSDANTQSTSNNMSDNVSQNVVDNSIVGTWLIDNSSYPSGTVEIIITNDGRVIVPDPKNPSRAIEGAINIKKISSDNSAVSGSFSSIAGTWSIEMQTVSPRYDILRAVITNDGFVDVENPFGWYPSGRIARIVRKISNDTTVPFSTISKFADVHNEWRIRPRPDPREMEARTFVGSLNRAQQASYLERQKFASNFDNAVGFFNFTVNNRKISDANPESENYSYRIFSPVDLNRTLRGSDPKQRLRYVVYHIGQAKQPNLKSYIGAVRIAKPLGSKEETTLAIECRTDSTTTSEPPLPVLVGDHALECAAGTHDINR